jgi:ribosomal protein S18 acetylase RimI-like enzyme
MARMTVDVRALVPGDAAWAGAVHRAAWGTPQAARLGELVDLRRLPGLVALLDGERAGLLNYDLRDGSLEVVSLVSLAEGRGVGRALLEGARRRAQAAGCRRLWLVTTNDNLRALALYQRFGMDIVALHHGAVARSRKLKPAIPEVGRNGIPIAHELELALELR